MPPPTEQAKGAGALSIGVDVGGTFTDVVSMSADGRLLAAKVPSTPGRAHIGVVTATRGILEQASAQPEDVRRFIHGTTVATNAIIEQRGAVLGVLMTAGFEDTLEIGRYKRSAPYDVWFDAETPVFLAPRRRRRGVIEGIDHRGEVLVPLDEDSVRQALIELVEKERVEAIAVCYLFSFQNPAHELRTAEFAHELYPGLPVSLSSRVNPEIREYERLCVTSFDAYIRPVVGDYLGRLAHELRTLGVPAPLQVMQSRGGIADARLAIDRPSTTIMSGPAAGVVGALHAAAASGFRDIISIDIGGTSSDVALAAEGRPLLSRDGKILTYPVRTPMVDVNSIGAGGGSVAWFDGAGSLHVGPRSAGADPGPACYGRGGTEATVTDASVVLGYINPEYFAGGSFPLDPELALAAVERVAKRLGSSPPKAAYGIHRIVNANMTDQIRLISIGRGHDPRRFALVLLGGAGALHGCPVAGGLGIETLIVPTLPGVLSAFGLLVSDVEYDQTRTFHMPLTAVEPGAQGHLELVQTFARMEADGLEAMAAQQIPAERVRVGRALDMRYVGQSYELEVPLDGDPDRLSADAVAAAFERKHEQIYGHVRRGEPPEILNLRTVHISPSPKQTPLRVQAQAGSLREARKGERQAYFGEHGLVVTPVYERSLLSVGTSLDGPAIIEQVDTTTVVRPGWGLRVDEAGQLILSKSGRPRQPSPRKGRRSAREVEGTTRPTIDPITLEVVRNRLEAVADEMENVVLRSSYSIIIKEAADCTTAIFTPDGDSIAHAVAIPLHLGVMGPAMRSILDTFPPHEMEEGDVYILNDPYLGGTHLPDLIVAMPVIHEGKPVAITAVLAHHQDMGGMVPGSMPSTATEIFQEGVIIPPLKLSSHGIENETLLKMIERNVRLPVEVLGDIHGQIGAATAGKERLLALFDEYGQEVVLKHMRELLDRAETMTRAEIRQIPDGSYTFEDYLDHDGVELDKRLLPVRATVTIEGERVEVDLTGTNPQTRGSANAPPSTSLAAVAYALRTILDPATPINGGSERPIHLILPEGSMVNPLRPAAVSLRAQLGSRVLRAIFGALARAIPGRIAADTGQHDGALGLAGIDPETRQAWGFAFCPVSGMGARPTKDGVDAIDSHLSNVLSVPAEAWESGYPLRLTRHALRRDSGGAGRWRGGLGLVWHFEVLRGEMTASWRGDRHFSCPWGLFGGKAGPPWQLLVHRRSGAVEEIPGRSVFTLQEGDWVELLGGGTGGYGDPLEREPERVLADVLNDKVSSEAAEHEYGVVLHGDPSKLDLSATATLRERLRLERGPITWIVDRGLDLGVE